MISEKILSQNLSLHVACTGSGAGAQEGIWRIPGVSAIFSGASFPYSQDELWDFLGFPVYSSCTAETAVDMAMQAYYQAYVPGGKPAIGVGLTASVATLKPHRGDHRAFCATFTDQGCLVHKMVLTKGSGKDQRTQDGFLCDILVANAINIACGEPEITHLPSDMLSEVDQPDSLARKRFFEHPFFEHTGRRNQEFPHLYYSTRKGALYFGSFDPPHCGHFGIVEQYQNGSGGPVCYAIEANHPEKGDLSVATLLRRAKALRGKDLLFTSGLPLYLDKIKAFPGVNQLMGMDAFLKLTDPAWTSDPAEIAKALDDNKTHLYVADRLIDGEVRSTMDSWASSNTTPLLDYARRVYGRWDISSSEIRGS